MSGLKVLVSVSERYGTAIDYPSYWLIQKGQSYDDDVSSEMQIVRKKVAVQMKDQEFYRQDSISVINLLTQFKRALDSSLIYERTAVLLFCAFMSSPALATFNGRLALSSNDVNRHVGTITTYTRMVNYLLR